MILEYWFGNEPFEYETGFMLELEAAKAINPEDPDSVSDEEIEEYLLDVCERAAEEEYEETEEEGFSGSAYRYFGVSEDDFY